LTTEAGRSITSPAVWLRKPHRAICEWASWDPASALYSPPR
jgi:hypothetical protein